ncbi:sulfite exporter TauE/SafE family protein [Vibrio sp. S4M6]|uniref:sulfite exporter TauE/SafE family protein n=1 Tax=Vibrio sinus TaxID=2946865 RepID=UPI00202ABDB0|nr:sulfite exporter TauE/SafE family protein [Vibrio sinus]
MTIDWLGAFFIGFLGSSHCIGMCGGIASLMTINHPGRKIVIPMLYNVGRLTSYALFGAIVGGTISTLAYTMSANHPLTWLRLVAAIFMILLALYLSNWWKGLVFTEKLGGILWQALTPVRKRVMPIKSPIYALPCGMVWGWLPCGLVYSALTWAAVSGGAVNGSLLMLAFGLGTLPAMFSIGYGANYFQRLKQSRLMRQTGALLILSYGIYTAYSVLLSLHVL